MPSQHSSRMRMPSDWETARQRHQEHAAEELAAYLARSDAMRIRLATTRVLIAGASSPCPSR